MMSAFIFIQFAASGGMTNARAAHDALHAVRGVKTVHFVAGPTDIIVFVDAADQNALMETVGAIRGVPGVASTDTRIVLPI